MDIRKWLEQVDNDGHDPDPGMVHKRRKHAERPKNGNVQTEERTRKRQKTDSSLLDPQPTPQQETSRKRRHCTLDSVNDYESEYDPTHTSATDSESSDQPYARRPRRKTRPDRYDPYPKRGRAAETSAHRSKKGKSWRSKRKPQQRKDEKPGISIAQNFHAKNVSGDRLTLKPRETLGLFNKGKTSTVVKGRGLPDLVFSEMRFLQKHDEEGAENLQPGPTKPKTRRKSEHARDREGEISSYFVTPRPPLAEKDQTTRVSQVRSSSRLSKLQRQQAEPSPAFDKPIPTIEVASKRGSLERGIRVPPTGGTSYASWSDSARGCSRKPAKQQARTLPPVRLAANAGSSGEPYACERSGLKCELPQFDRRLRPEGDTAGDRFVVSTLGPSTDSVPRTKSLPARTSSPHKHEDTKRVRSAAAKIYRSSLPETMTTEDERRVAIEHGRDDLRSVDRPPTGYHDAEEHAPHSRHSQSSYGLEQAIWHCHHAIPRAGRAGSGDVLPNISAGQMSTNLLGQNSGIRLHHLADGNSGVRFAASTVQHSDARNFTGRGIYEQQEEGFVQAPIRFVDVDSDALYRHYLSTQNIHDDDGFADNDQDGREVTPGSFEEDMLDSIMQSGTDGPEFDDGQTYLSDVVVRPIQSNHGATASAFWRPNRLY